MTVTTWRPAIETKFAELLALPAGWNGHAAAPISPGATQRALALLDATMQDDTPAPSVVPLSDGGVQLEWHCRGLDIEVGVHRPGRLVECWSNDANGRWTHDDELKDEHAIAWMRLVMAELSSQPTPTEGVSTKRLTSRGRTNPRRTGP